MAAADVMLILGIILAAGAAGAAVLLGIRLRRERHAHRQEDISRQHEQHQQLQSIEQEKRVCETRIVQLEAQLDKLQYRYDQLLSDVQEKDRTIADFRGREESYSREVRGRIEQLESARKHLEEERERLHEEERLRREEEQQNWDRMWAVHEEQTAALMREVCSRPHTQFTYFDNKHLPDDFDESLRPDFMIQFLDQYVIFDAKSSKNDRLDQYLSAQVKQTVKKIQASPYADQIYRTIFFVVPAAAAGTLRSISYYEQGYSFYIIPPQAFEPLAAMFSKLESYEIADAYDPQEREDIIDVIAALEHHIRHQNAVNVLEVLRGLKSLEHAQQLPDDMGEAVAARRKRMRTESLKPSDLKRYIHDPEAVKQEIVRLITSRKPAVSDDELSASADDADGESDADGKTADDSSVSK